MPRLDWGLGIGLHFYNSEEYYETLGFYQNSHSLYMSTLIKMT